MYGRTTDFLKLNNTIIGSPVLTVLMGNFDMDQYQIVQEAPDSIICRIVKGRTYNTKSNEEYIRRSFHDHVGQINITFDYTDSITATKSGKHKFIINLTEPDEK